MKPLITINNNGSIVTREMTDEEYAAFLLMQTENEQKKLEEEARQASKNALLDRLGITEEEAKLLLS